MKDEKLSEFIEAAASKFGIPGAAAGVLVDGNEFYACHGVTSTDNPLPVDQNTLFLLGSVSKTYTATAMMRLVAEGRADLEAPVRRYVPELRLADERLAAEVTVLNLLNHTSGLGWGLVLDTGEGDDALAKYVAALPDVQVLGAPGERTSYSQAGFNLAGRIIEKVTGQTFERAVASLLLEPVRLAHSFYARDDVMTRRFAVGHNRGEDGTLSIARLWRRPRGDSPGGGLASSVSDQIRWAQYHLGDGRSARGDQVLPGEALRRMQQPTARLVSSDLGDAVGVGWFLREIDGVRTVGHDGTANGQVANLLIVPERRFAVVALSNQAPDGIPFNREVVRWALQTYLGITDRDLEPLPYDEARAKDIVGTYENEVFTLTIDTRGGTGLGLDVHMKPEIRAAADKELPPDPEPSDLGLLPGDKDEYIITTGAYKGLRGFFTRDEQGAIVGVDLAGPLMRRISADSRSRAAGSTSGDGAPSGEPLDKA